jgi:hypothetical protein
LNRFDLEYHAVRWGLDLPDDLLCLADRLALEDLYLLVDPDYLLETSNRQDRLDQLDLYNLTFIYDI